MKKRKYLLNSAGKFHHFELGKVLLKKNQLSKIISGYPWFKLKKEGIPKRFVEANGLMRVLREPLIKLKSFKQIDHFLNIYAQKKIDKITSKIIDKDDEIDVLIAQSKCGLESGKNIKSKGKLYVCDRLSTHIDFQNNILQEEYKELNLEYTPIKSWYLDRERKEYEAADMILVPSNFNKSTFGDNLKDKVKVLEFGVNNKNFFRNENIKKSNTHFDILFLASKSVRKGLHYLIEAFKKFKHPNKRLHVIGSNTSDSRFYEKKLQQENIIIYGHVDHLKLNDLINTCHTYVLPSIEEGFAYTILQVAAAGCPVIVTENTGAGDFVRRSNCGFVVPIRNINSIVDKLTLLADNRILLNELSFNAQNYSKENNWETYFKKLESIINEKIND
jgi:starch synthase